MTTASDYRSRYRSLYTELSTIDRAVGRVLNANVRPRTAAADIPAAVSDAERTLIRVLKGYTSIKGAPDLATARPTHLNEAFWRIVGNVEGLQQQRAERTYDGKLTTVYAMLCGQRDTRAGFASSPYGPVDIETMLEEERATVDSWLWLEEHPQAGGRLHEQMLYDLANRAEEIAEKIAIVAEGRGFDFGDKRIAKYLAPPPGMERILSYFASHRAHSD